MYFELNKIVEEEIAKSGPVFSFKLKALENFQTAIENVRSYDPKSIEVLREATKELCKWWPEYIAYLVSSFWEE